jgi:hypothetical protein
MNGHGGETGAEGAPPEELADRVAGEVPAVTEGDGSADRAERRAGDVASQLDPRLEKSLGYGGGERHESLHAALANRSHLAAGVQRRENDSGSARKMTVVPGPDIDAQGVSRARSTPVST